MPSGYDIWGVVASVFGLFSLFQLISAFVHGRLPLKRLRTFDQTLEETEGLLRSVEEEGLFDDDGEYISSAKRQIQNVCNRIRRLRGDAFAAKTLRQEISQWWRGLSREIGVCCDELRSLRAQVSTTSNERRKALAQRQNHLNASDDSQLGAPTSAIETAHGTDLASRVEMNGVAPHEVIKPAHRPLEDSADVLINNPKSKSNANPPPPNNHDTVHITSRSDSTDIPPSYRRHSNPPPYPVVPALVLARCTISSADAARATRKLVKAYRRNLMVRNVPWHSQEAQHRHLGTSPAASARAADRPSNSTRHWKLLEEMSRSTFRPYVAFVSHESTLVRSPRATGLMDV